MLISALNFPARCRRYAEGFCGARPGACRNPEIAKVIRAAEDVLTLLSQDGVYAEDLGNRTGPCPSCGAGLPKGARGRKMVPAGRYRRS
jgi:hypothetical protein